MSTCELEASTELQESPVAKRSIPERNPPVDYNPPNMGAFGRLSQHTADHSDADQVSNAPVALGRNFEATPVCAVGAVGARETVQEASAAFPRAPVSDAWHACDRTSTALFEASSVMTATSTEAAVDTSNTVGSGNKAGAMQADAVHAVLVESHEVHTSSMHASDKEGAVQQPHVQRSDVVPCEGEEQFASVVYSPAPAAIPASAEYCSATAAAPHAVSAVSEGAGHQEGVQGGAMCALPSAPLPSVPDATPAADTGAEAVLDRLELEEAPLEDSMRANEVTSADSYYDVAAESSSDSSQPTADALLASLENLSNQIADASASLKKNKSGKQKHARGASVHAEEAAAAADEQSSELQTGAASSDVKSQLGGESVSTGSDMGGLQTPAAAAASPVRQDASSVDVTASGDQRVQVYGRVPALTGLPGVSQLSLAGRRAADAAMRRAQVQHAQHVQAVPTTAPVSFPPTNTSRGSSPRRSSRGPGCSQQTARSASVAVSRSRSPLDAQAQAYPARGQPPALCLNTATESALSKGGSFQKPHMRARTVSPKGVAGSTTQGRKTPRAYINAAQAEFGRSAEAVLNATNASAGFGFKGSGGPLIPVPAPKKGMKQLPPSPARKVTSAAEANTAFSASKMQVRARNVSTATAANAAAGASGLRAKGHVANNPFVSNVAAPIAPMHGPPVPVSDPVSGVPGVCMPAVAFPAVAGAAFRSPQTVASATGHQIGQPLLGVSRNMPVASAVPVLASMAPFVSTGIPQAARVGKAAARVATQSAESRHTRLSTQEDSLLTQQLQLQELSAKAEIQAAAALSSPAGTANAACDSSSSPADKSWKPAVEKAPPISSDAVYVSTCTEIESASAVSTATERVSRVEGGVQQQAAEGKSSDIAVILNETSSELPLRALSGTDLPVANSPVARVDDSAMVATSGDDGTGPLQPLHTADSEVHAVHASESPQRAHRAHRSKLPGATQSNTQSPIEPSPSSVLATLATSARSPSPATGSLCAESPVAESPGADLAMNGYERVTSLLSQGTKATLNPSGISSENDFGTERHASVSGGM